MIQAERGSVLGSWWLNSVPWCEFTKWAFACCRVVGTELLTPNEVVGVPQVGLALGKDVGRC